MSRSEANIMKNIIIFSVLSSFLVACAQIEPKPMDNSPGHITTDSQSVAKKMPVDPASIPQVVQQEPILPEPSETAPELEKYTVVVNDVPVRELLFALARDADVNVDIAPGIEGTVTLNAVEQTMPQILDRISRQVDIRYEYQNNNLLVSADQAYLKSYKIDYVNIARETDSQITIATQIATTGTGDVAGGSAGGGAGGGGNNNSTTDVRSQSFNNFWENLVRNIQAIIGEEVEDNSGGQEGEITITNNVIPSPESGVLTVNATSKQHKLVQGFIDQVMNSANRQVLVQATIVEVTLNDNYQAGIDWSFINNLAGLSFSTAGLTTGISAASAIGSAAIGLVSTTPTGSNEQTGGFLRYQDTDIGGEGDALTATVNLLDEFGDTKVLSSPQMMVLNNQTAVLKVVENLVYFEIDAEPGVATLAGVGQPAIDTTAKTVPVGLVMSMTPYISENDDIILNVRPTISRRIADVRDPQPQLPANIPNNVPVIAVREMESMLRMNDGEIAVLGGLMSDETSDLDRGIPGLKDIPGVGRAFSSKRIETQKTELVIFLRPIVIKDPSVDGDLDLYKPFLQSNNALSGTVGAR